VPWRHKIFPARRHVPPCRLGFLISAQHGTARAVPCRACVPVPCRAGRLSIPVVDSTMKRQALDNNINNALSSLFTWSQKCWVAARGSWCNLLHSALTNLYLRKVSISLTFHLPALFSSQASFTLQKGRLETKHEPAITLPHNKAEMYNY